MKSRKAVKQLKKNDFLWISGTTHKITSVKKVKAHGKLMIRVEAVGLPPMLFNENESTYINVGD